MKCQGIFRQNQGNEVTYGNKISQLTCLSLLPPSPQVGAAVPIFPPILYCVGRLDSFLNQMRNESNTNQN